jgi:hypothetical protein
VIGESEGVGCQDEGSLCRERHKQKSEHIASVILERLIGGV